MREGDTARFRERPEVAGEAPVELVGGGGGHGTECLSCLISRSLAYRTTTDPGTRRWSQIAVKERELNGALDELLAEHERRVRRLSRVDAAAVLVAAGRLLLMDFPLRDRVRVERRVEELLP